MSFGKTPDSRGQEGHGRNDFFPSAEERKDPKDQRKDWRVGKARTQKPEGKAQAKARNLEEWAKGTEGKNRYHATTSRICKII